MKELKQNRGLYLFKSLSWKMSITLIQQLWQAAKTLHGNQCVLLSMNTLTQTCYSHITVKWFLFIFMNWIKCCQKASVFTFLNKQISLSVIYSQSRTASKTSLLRNYLRLDINLHAFDWSLVALCPLLLGVATSFSPDVLTTAQKKA